MIPLPAYILAGGRSTRFGSDKARALLEGEPLLARIARLARVAGAGEVFAVAREAGVYDDLGVKTIADLRPGLGPLSGLEAALAHAREGWILLLTCDQLICAPAWVGKLRAVAEGFPGSEGLRPLANEECLVSRGVEILAPGKTAAVFHDGARFQPVPGLYRADLLSEVSRTLDAAQAGGPRASFQRLLTGAQAARVPLPADWPSRLQANMPEDLPG